MALDFTSQNVLPTPENYATPEQVKSIDDYVALLRKNSTQPVSHWSQGVANMANALMGGYLQEQARRAQQGTTVAGQVAKPLPAGTAAPIGVPPANPKDGLTSLSDTGGASSSAEPMAAEKKAVSSIESGGDYGAVGPVVKSGQYAGDRAYGKYQVMGKNIPQWTAEVLGQPMTPEQFRADPSAQERVFERKFASLEGKYGPVGASKAWFAGEKGMNNPNAKDDNGTTVASYAQKFSNVMGGPPQAPGPALAFNGPGAPSAQGAAPAQQAIAAAAGGKPVQAPNTNVPLPNGSGQYFDPRLIPQRPQVSRDQYIAVMSNPFASPADKALVESEYQAQNLPNVLPWPGGSVYTKGPVQQFIPTPLNGASKIGPIEHQQMLIPDGKGNLIRAPILSPGQQPPQAPPGPQGALAPSGGGPTLPAGGQPPANIGQNGPAAPAGGPALALAPQGTPGGVNAPPASPEAGKPVQVASLDPTVGGAPKPIVPNTPPPGAVAANATEGTPHTSPGQEFPGVPPGVSPEDWQAYIATKKSDAAGEALKSDLTTQGTEYSKKYSTIISQGQNSSTQLPQLELAKQMVQNPETAQGLLAQPKLLYQRMLASMGMGNVDTATSTQLFQKLISGSILDGLRAFTQGASVGQIRTAEIALQKLAAANIENTPQANMALLNIATRLHTLNVDIANKAADYHLQHGKIDAGFDKEVLKFMKANPILTPGDYKLITDIGNAADKGEKPGAGGGEASKVPTQADIDYLTKNPTLKDRFDKQFGTGAADKILGGKK